MTILQGPLDRVSLGDEPAPAPPNLGQPRAAITVLGLPDVPEVWAAGETIFLLGKTAIRADSPKSIKWIVTPKERGDRSVQVNDPVLGPILCRQQ